MKTDLKRTEPAYTARAGVFSVVTVPPLQYLMVDGSGDPNTAPAYADAIAAIYPVAYALKFSSKARGRDYTVMPLEALWWADDMASFTGARDKSRWQWTLLNRVPDWLGPDDLDAAVTAVRSKQKPGQPPVAVDRIRLETLDEGLSVQTLHLGPYDDEAEVLAALHEDFIAAHGLRMAGRHHEIYFTDARRTAPAKLRTLLRQPVERDPGAH